jgi:hypothetical protein
MEEIILIYIKSFHPLLQIRPKHSEFGRARFMPNLQKTGK